MTHTRHYVKFISPGTFFPETSSQPIASWDTKQAVAMSESITERYGARPYGFVFETYIEHDDVSDGAGGKMRVEPKRVRQSHCHYLGGRVETYDDVVARADPKEKTLLSNMRSARIALVLIHERGYRSVLPFETEHIVLDAAGNVAERGDSRKWVAYREGFKAIKDGA